MATVIVREGPIIRVRINGVLDTLCLQAEAVHGFDVKVASAVAVFPRAPNAREWDWVEIDLGPDAAGTFARFAGYLVKIDYELFPTGVSLICAGSLVRAQRKQGTTNDDNPEGIDLSLEGVGQTDQAMVEYLLEQSGIANFSIDGTGKILGTIADDQFYWPATMSAYDFIESLDEICLGFKTFNTPAGATVRRKILAQPGDVASVSFTEGFDIERASAHADILDVFNRVHVTGYDEVEAITEQYSPFLPSGIEFVTLFHGSPKIEKELESDPEEGISCEEDGVWLLGERNRKIVRIPFVTPRSDFLFPGMTIAVNAPTRLGTATNYWLQNLKVEVTADGQFSQHLTLIGGVGSTAPAGIKPIADFTILVEVESVVIAGVETDIYVVHAVSTSLALTGSVVSLAWTATGGTPSSGSGETFTSVYTDLTSKTLTLTVTAANGLSDTRSKVILTAAPTNQHVVRALYLAGGVEAEAWSGFAWGTDAPTSGTVNVAANGPYWGAGTRLMYSEDYLATAATESTPFGAASVTAGWAELDVSTGRVLLGSSDGRLAYATDAAVP